jgi:hypothetical protein
MKWNVNKRNSSRVSALREIRGFCRYDVLGQV